jgi:ABC-2 type transport system ATP-binding protein
VSDATRRLAEREVLRRVSVEVARGEVVALVGPNGAGKSSLLRAIGGRLALDAGVIAIAGVAGADARARGLLGIVPQDVALHGHLSVGENLRLWAALSGVPRHDRDERIAHGLDAIGLVDRASARVDRLSGGMRRRVNVLAGLLHRPVLLLLDEPTVGVDDDSRRRLSAWLRALRAGGLGVLLATHDLDEAAAVADRVVVLDAGAVVASDSVSGLVARFCAPAGDLVVHLRAVAESAARLLAEGFTRVDERQWVRPSTDAAVDLVALDRHLRTLGIDVAEVGYRRPTLQGAIAAALGAGRSPAA